MSYRYRAVRQFNPSIRLTLRSLATLCTLMLTCTPTQRASAQAIPPGIMICQTPAFWCVVPSQDYPTGVPCWCNTPMGPVVGRAINPRQVVQQSAPSKPSKHGRDEPEEEIDLGGKADDCLNGLGNCDGSFASLVRKNAKTRAPKESRSGCTKDTDCKGDRVCEQGKCIDQ